MKNAKTAVTTRTITYAAIIAALYVVLTYITNLFGLASGVIQVRVSELLTILPAIIAVPFGGAAVAGVTIGCLLANILTGCVVWDIVFGTLATLLGAIGTYLLRKHLFLAWIPPVVANTIIVPQVLIHAYGVTDALWFLTLTVGVGEIISCGVLGLLFGYILRRPLSRITKI